MITFRLPLVQPDNNLQIETASGKTIFVRSQPKLIHYVKHQMNPTVISVNKGKISSLAYSQRFQTLFILKTNGDVWALLPPSHQIPQSTNQGILSDEEIELKDPEETNQIEQQKNKKQRFNTDKIPQKETQTQEKVPFILLDKVGKKVLRDPRITFILCCEFHLVAFRIPKNHLKENKKKKLQRDLDFEIENIRTEKRKRKEKEKEKRKKKNDKEIDLEMEIEKETNNNIDLDIEKEEEEGHGDDRVFVDCYSLRRLKKKPQTQPNYSHPLSICRRGNLPSCFLFLSNTFISDSLFYVLFNFPRIDLDRELMLFGTTDGDIGWDAIASDASNSGGRVEELGEPVVNLYIFKKNWFIAIGSYGRVCVITTPKKKATPNTTEEEPSSNNSPQTRAPQKKPRAIRKFTNLVGPVEAVELIKPSKLIYISQGSVYVLDLGELIGEKKSKTKEISSSLSSSNFDNKFKIHSKKLSIRSDILKISTNILITKRGEILWIDFERFLNNSLDLQKTNKLRIYDVTENNKHQENKKNKKKKK
ncbi:ensconsin isoform f [Anaeramoeba flamelloides]|uniref:Ensconsin isoform f n=1 Tax=Anaeramoeba flamelloides TaxID=1746091 RepID=A0AAV7Z5M2_9EUKA|nr:ensconsin isoform f [Anaeramoeba flamelloides]